jgi:hypothetical protein
MNPSAPYQLSMILKNRQAPQMPPAHFARSPTVRSRWRDEPAEANG